MKKTIIIFSIMLFCILVVVCVSVTQNQENLATIKKENAVYEEYKDKTVFGTEVATIINKAINTNIKNNIEQDDDGFYINNNINSVQVEIKLLNDGQLISYKMETIKKVGTEGFIKNFNLIMFKCTSIEYHNQTKRVSKIVFEQIEE